VWLLLSVCRFFTDAYDLYMVGVITPMIAFARFPDYVKGGNFGSLPDQYDLMVKGMALVGTLVGQVRPYMQSIWWVGLQGGG
jgi:PHS family inorganic phosphate transporter-like MFS transporter